MHTYEMHAPATDGYLRSTSLGLMRVLA